MSKRRTVFIPLNLGVADRFDRSIFPMSLSKSEALTRGELFLEATVEEVFTVASMCANLSQTEDLARTTHLRYTELMQEKARLENRTTTRNPLKEFANYRAVKIFYKAAKSLYIETKTTSELMAGSLGRGSRFVSIEGEEENSRKREHLTSRDEAHIQCTSQSDEDSSKTRHDPSPLFSPSGPVSTPRKVEQPVSENLPERPTIQGIVASDVDPDKIPDLERTITDAFHMLTSKNNMPAIKKFIDQWATVMEDASLDPATLQTSQVPTQDEKCGQVSRPETSCSARCSVKVVLRDTIIAPNATFIGTSLSQGRSHNSGPVRHDVTVPPPPESS